ncbi:MAG: hypothetical protein MRY59_04355 [Aquisalinus sp.]|nr:hypothetical protein [Aquisalinus sp.]
MLFQYGQQQQLISGLGYPGLHQQGPAKPPYTPQQPGIGYGPEQYASYYNRLLEYFALNHGPRQDVNGYGNNSQNPEWGQAGTELNRITPHRPGAFFDPTLPNARDVSNTIFSQKEDIPNTHGTTHFIWMWGQFIDHDIGLTSNKGDFVPIVGSDGRTIPFTRAGNTENEITSFIDASSVYGSDEERLAALREGPDSPYLKINKDGGLPYNTAGLENENGPNPNADPADFFLAGDVRANENPALTGMHLIFAKDHNKTVDILKNQYPEMSAEQLFTRARQVTEAKIQKVTYDEFLPALGIKVPESRGYDPTVNPQLSAEFTTAAFRFGHSSVGNVPLLDKEGKQVGTLELSKAFFNPDMAKGDTIEQLFRGAAGDLHQEIDGKIVDDLRDQLFIIRDREGNPVEAGSDLAALNIARGRDHGIGTFNDHRVAAGLERLTSFEQLSSDPKVQAQLKSLYKDVDDVDAWVGMLLEDDAPGSQLGATATTLIGNQFAALRDGDATYYKNGGVLTPFEMQLVENSSLSRVITDNTGIHEGELADNVFFHPDHQPEPEYDYPPLWSQTAPWHEQLYPGWMWQGLGGNWRFWS